MAEMSPATFMGVVASWSHSTLQLCAWLTYWLRLKFWCLASCAGADLGQRSPKVHLPAL